MHGTARDAAVADGSASEQPDKRRWARFASFALLSAAVLAMLAGAQSAWFYATIPPRVDRANQRLYDLMLETSQRSLYRSIALQVERLRNTAAATPGESIRLAEAWREFETRFAAAPEAAARELRNAVSAFGAAAGGAGIEGLERNLVRLQTLYTDHYEPLVEELESPPAFLWPSVPLLAERSGYREAMTLNRAMHLAQVGDIGTARVILTGLQASTDDSRMLGLTYFMLGRLQFEIFRARPEADYYLQSVQYLRQSLEAWPDSEPAKRFIDYLLSLNRSEAAPRTLRGRPTIPSKGEGASVSEEERRF